MPRRPVRLVALAVARIAGLPTPPCPGAEPGSGSFAPTGTVRLASGIAVHYECHGGQNALVDLVAAGGALIARTKSGDLLRFAPATLGLTRERSGPVPATCLVRGEDGTALAGFADGRVVRIDPANLEVGEIARVSGKVQWVGMMPGLAGRPGKSRPVAVVERTKWGEDEEGKRAEIPYSIVEDFDLGQIYELEGKNEIPGGLRASAFLLDRKHRLWVAANNDEWGSWCSYVDLGAGKVRSLPGPYIFGMDWPPSWFGIYGLIELRDGQVWAYGGITHMEQAEAFIARVDAGKLEELYRRDNRSQLRHAAEVNRRAAGIGGREAKVEPRPEPPPADRPRDPITWITEDPRTGAPLVFSFNDVHRTDVRLARWEKIHELKIDYGWSRPDTLGAHPYPSMRSVVPIEESGRPMALVFATPHEGLIRLADGRETAAVRSLGVNSIGRIAASSEGILVLDGSEGGGTWRYRDGAWSTVSFEPPDQPHLDGPDARGQSGDIGQLVTRVLIDRDGSVIAVSASSAERKGLRTVARWRHGKPEILGREVSILIPSESFLTPDGQLWNADHSAIRRFVDGRWVDVGIASRPGLISPGLMRPAHRDGSAMQLAPINHSGPPWNLVDPAHEMLLRLSYGPDFRAPGLTSVPLTKSVHELRPRVRDAIPWAKGELPLATDQGLRTVAVDGVNVSIPRLDTEGRPVSRLARDGRGRLWLGGEGLAVLDADGRTLHPLDELPMLGRSKIEALAADPAHPDGVIAALSGRGLLFVRVEGR